MKYHAFISYSHRDSSWGDWLHRALETYKVPTALVGRATDRGETVPARLFPMFRDREELPTATDLGEVIQSALRESRYLIVICSPRSAHSRWVHEEILAFKRLGRENRVLAIIVDGEPNAADGKPGFTPEQECFPLALKFKLGPDGNLSAERTEPIAADARPHADGRSNALLKLLAGVLGVDYDELSRRDLKRRLRAQRIWTLASTAVAGALLALTVWAWRERAEALARNYEAAIRGATSSYQLRDYVTARELLKQRPSALDGWEAAYLAGLLQRSEPSSHTLPTPIAALPIALVPDGEGWKADTTAHPTLGQLRLSGEKPDFVGRMPGSESVFAIRQSSAERKFIWLDARGMPTRSVQGNASMFSVGNSILAVTAPPDLPDQPVIITRDGVWALDRESDRWLALLDEHDYTEVTAWHFDPLTRTLLVAADKGERYNRREVNVRTRVYQLTCSIEGIWASTTQWDTGPRNTITALYPLASGYAFATATAVGANLGGDTDGHFVAMPSSGEVITQLHAEPDAVFSRAENGETRRWPIRASRLTTPQADGFVLHSQVPGTFVPANFESYAAVSAATWSPSGQLLVVGREDSYSNFALTLDPVSGGWLPQGPQLHASETEPGATLHVSRLLLRMAFSADRKRIYGLLGSEDDATLLANLSPDDPESFQRLAEMLVVTWDETSGRQIGLQSLVAGAPNPPVPYEEIDYYEVFGFDPLVRNGSPPLSVTTGEGGELIVRDPTSGGDPVQLAARTGDTHSALSPDGRRLARCDRGYVLISDAATDRVLLNLSVGDPNTPAAYVSWSPDGRHLVIAKFPDEIAQSGLFVLSAHQQP